MVEIKRTSLALQTLLQDAQYLPLIDPASLQDLKTLSHLAHWVALEARLEHELIGFALIKLYPFSKIAQFESLVVKPSFRRKGIGQQLFAFAQKIAAEEEKMNALEVQYDQEQASAQAIEKILASLQWPPARTFLIRCHFEASAFNPSWINHPFHLPPTMRFFPWKDLKPEEREYIEYLGQQGRFLPYLSPFRDEASLDLETSVGLRQEGKIIGWSITRRPDPSTIRYSSLYIDSSYLKAGYGIQLLVESIRRQKQLPIPNAIFEINVKEIDPSWWRFVKKRLLPLSTRVERIKRAFRIFHHQELD